MKIIHSLLFSFMTFLTVAQTTDSERVTHFGVDFHLSYTSLIECIAFTPTVTYYRNKHQVELGIPFFLYPYQYNPNFYDNKLLLGTDLAYKFYPNSISNRFNMFIEISSKYIYTRTQHSYINDYWEGYYNYVWTTITQKNNDVNLLTGIGFQYRAYKNAYISTSLQCGIKSHIYNSYNSYLKTTYYHDREYAFDYGLELSFGYRF